MTVQFLSPQQAAALVNTRDAIGLGLITGTPTVMLRALSERTDWEDLTLSGGLILGRYELFTHPGVHLRASFYGGAERSFVQQGGDVQFIPSYFRHYGLLIQHLAPRVMITPASMPDAHGRVSLSLYNGAHLEEFVRAGRDPDRLLIVECSPYFPRTHALTGHVNTIDLEDIDVVVYTEERPTVFPNDPGSPEDQMIASHAAQLIPDGATLQTGIGAVPNLVVQALAQGSGGDYGVHSEMFTDGLFQLIAAGKVTNAQKSLNPGVSVITFAAGGREMYDYLDDNPSIGVAPVFYTNDPHIIEQNSRMVSINSALEVDLLGQIVADTLGSRQYSGVGGHMDFLEGTSLRLSHKSLICLQSTAMVNGELKSRIVADIARDAVVTSPRHLAGFIVTEYGSVDLRGLSVRERAHELVNIAHPQFRDELRQAAERLGR